jgi:hypothetical protein
MVSLGVEFGGKLKHVLGTVFHAKRAAFASLLYDVKFAVRNVELVGI